MTSNSILRNARGKGIEDREGKEDDEKRRKKVKKRRSYLNLEEEKRIFCVGLFIYFSCFFFRPL